MIQGANYTQIYVWIEDWNRIGGNKAVEQNLEVSLSKNLKNRGHDWWNKGSKMNYKKSEIICIQTWGDEQSRKNY